MHTITNAAALVARYLSVAKHSWSIGVAGAIGEFMYDADEPVDICINGNEASAETWRGAIQIGITPDTRCVAYRQSGACTETPSQTLAFCVPHRNSKLTARARLTELGPDRDAVTTPAREDILFDLGLGSTDILFCIRTADPDLLQTLRAGCGHSVFERRNPVFAAMRAASPARVIISSLGRIEIYGSIPVGKNTTPTGPHTHLLPHLLGQQVGGEPIPANHVVALNLYPEHPEYDKYGRAKTFDPRTQADFENLMTALGTDR